MRFIITIICILFIHLHNNAQSSLLADNLEDRVDQQKEKILSIIGEDKYIYATHEIKRHSISFSDGSYMYYLNEDDIPIRISTITGKEAFVEMYDQKDWIMLTGTQKDDQINYAYIAEYLFETRKEEETENLEIISGLLSSNKWDRYQFDRNRRDFLFCKDEVRLPYCVYRVEQDFFKRDKENTYIADLSKRNWNLLPLFPGEKRRQHYTAEELLKIEQLAFQAQNDLEVIVTLSNEARFDRTSILYRFVEQSDIPELLKKSLVLKNNVPSFKYFSNKGEEFGRFFCADDNVYYYRTNLQPRMYKLSLNKYDIMFLPLISKDAENGYTRWIDKSAQIEIIVYKKIIANIEQMD
jgi:hypothetical protein